MSTDQVAGRLLQELNTSDVKQALDTLGKLIAELEEKPDPEPIELEIVSNTYQLIEKFNLVQNLLESYSGKTKEKLLGNKLTALYEGNTKSWNNF